MLLARRKTVRTNEQCHRFEQNGTCRHVWETSTGIGQKGILSLLLAAKEQTAVAKAKKAARPVKRKKAEPFLRQ
jgi:rhamnogalacturonyl hydrolase YesR